MRVCPKCDYIDHAYWRHSRFNRWYDYTEFENFEILFPKIADTLKKEIVSEDKHNVYRLSKGGFVYRLAKLDGGEDWKTRFHDDTQEKPKHKKNDHNQTKLLEVAKQ